MSFNLDLNYPGTARWHGRAHRFDIVHALIQIVIDPNYSGTARWHGRARRFDMSFNLDLNCPGRARWHG